MGAIKIDMTFNVCVFISRLVASGRNMGGSLV